jgi:Lar family restriction alleviation protein
MNTILQDCPFCGHSPVGESWKGRKGYEAVVQCNGCGANIVSTTWDTEEEAATEVTTAWNHRHEPAPLPLEPLPPSPIDPVVQHHPCNDCPFDPAFCKTEECERLKRYDAAREEEQHAGD